MSENDITTTNDDIDANGTRKDDKQVIDAFKLMTITRGDAPVRKTLRRKRLQMGSTRNSDGKCRRERNKLWLSKATLDLSALISILLE